MKRIFLSTIVVGTLVATGLTAQRIEKRKENQQDRIAQGVASGELTPKETARLETKEAALNKEIRRDRRDGGKLTRAERRKINRQQNALSRQIARQKHDAQKQ